MAHLGCTIGIDIGTSSVKAIAFDAKMQEIAHPPGRVGTPQEVARAVRYLIVDGEYITGQTLNINGGRNSPGLSTYPIPASP